MKLLLTIIFFGLGLTAFAQVASRDRALVSNDTLLLKAYKTVDQLSKKKKKGVFEIISAKPGTVPLIVIEGTIFNGSPDSIDTDKIQTIEVLKGDDAQRIYGKKAKDGAVLISMKRPASNLTEAKPLILVNDTVRDMNAMYQLNPNNVAWIDVIKSAKELADYGTAGANGVVKIYMKDHVKRTNYEKLSKLSETYKQYTRIHPDKEIICMINGTIEQDGGKLYKLSLNDVKQTDFQISETAPSINIITRP